LALLDLSGVFNVFLNQKIRVQLEVSKEIQNVSIEELKKRILKAFKSNKYFWSSRDDFDDLQEVIGAAESHREIIEILNK
jgi:hypothetical protein